MAHPPNFSAFPWERLPRLSRRDAAMQTTVACWVGAHTRGPRLAKLLGTEVTAHVAGGASASTAHVVGGASASLPASGDRYAAACVVRIGGAAIEVIGSSAGMRAIAQRVLGGPAELDAPRPLGVVEESIWALVVAAALEDLGVAGEVISVVGSTSGGASLSPSGGASPSTSGGASLSPSPPPSRPPSPSSSVVLDVRFGTTVMAVEIRAPLGLDLRAAPSRPLPAWVERWTLEIPVVVGRCALHRDDLARLAPRQLVTLDRPTSDSDPRRFHTDLVADLDVFGGTIGIRGAPTVVVAEVATGYVARDMALPDDAHVELTVAVGTTQLSLRQVLDLSIGQIVQLGRPLGGPFEVRAQGRVVGRGELVDVDGELAVRIVSLGD